MDDLRRRAGRTAVTRLQYNELVERIERLESLLLNDTQMTKPEIMKALNEKGIEYNPRDKKEILLSLLEE